MRLCPDEAETVLIALLRRSVSEEHLLYSPSGYKLGPGRNGGQARLGVQVSLLALPLVWSLFGPGRAGPK